MAVIKQPQATRLMLKVENGTGASGQTLYKTKTFQNVKASASDADVYAVGSALAGLQSHAVSAISRGDDAILVNE